MENNPSKSGASNDTTRPGFLGGAGGGETPVGLNTSAPGSGKTGSYESGSALKAAEEAATNGTIAGGDGSAKDAREAEEQVGGFYSGSGKKNGGIAKMKGVTAKFSPKSAIFGIIFALLGAGGAMIGLQTTQFASLIAQFQENFNSTQVSARRRANKFFYAQMDSGRTRNPIKKSIFGQKLSISEKQATELKKQGIEYIDDFEGTGVKVMKYQGDDGEFRIVTATESEASRLGDLTRFNGDDVKYNSEAKDFKAAYANDNGFFRTYNAGSMTWRGAVVGWFESNTKNFLKNNKLTRNLFANYREKVAEAGADADRLKVATEMMNKGAEDIGGGGVENRNLNDDEYREDGKTETKEDGSESKTYEKKGILEGILQWLSFGANRSNDESSYENNKQEHERYKRSDIKSEDDVKIKLTAMADKYKAGGGSFSKVANYTCLGIDFLGGVSLLVQASEALQIMHLTTGYFEVFDKTKAGYGDNAPINELLNALNEPKENKHKVLSSDGKTTETYPSYKSAMESSGIASLYSGTAINAKDPSVRSFNFTGDIKKVMGGFGASMDVFKSCSIARIAAAGIDLAFDGLKVVGCVAGIVGTAFTFGASAAACAPLAEGLISNIGFSVGIDLLITGIIGVITPVVTNALTRDLIANIGGEDLGNALTSGANMYLGGVHRANGGSLATRDEYTQYAIAHQAVIAENARLERESLSPFDVTSEYTFMGKFVNSLMGLTQTVDVMDTLTAGGTAVSNALAALNPTATAYNIAASLPDEDEYAETCPYLASIGAIGDAFCNPYAITDVSTMDLDPQYDVIDKLAEEGSFTDAGDEDSNVTVNQDSELFKYALLCDQRTSAFGMVDQNVANAVSATGSLSTTVSSAIGAVPIIGDTVGIFDDAEKLANIGYITGEACVAGNNVSGTAPDWDKAKYYQRFIEDQTLAESMGLIEKSAIAVALEDYYDKNPLDNSYEGMLARYSGMEKEDVVALLDIIDYYDYIAQYDPAERYSFGEMFVAENSTDIDTLNMDFGREDVLAGGVVLVRETIYNSVRNRNFAA